MASDVNVVSLWQNIVNVLEQDPNVTPQNHGFLNLVVPKGIMAGTFYLEVPNDFTRNIIEQQIRVPLLTAFAQTSEHDEINNFAIVVNKVLEEQFQEVEADPQPEFSPEVNPAVSIPVPVQEPQVGFPGSTNIETFQGIDLETRLNPKYTFENFVQGASNRLTHAAALAVAEAPGRAYNPLFIYGNSGLGKTHLLHAIGNYAQTLFQGIRVKYVSSEEFTNDFINSLSDNRMVSFQARYRDGVDILLIDDIQFLGGKEETQESFFHVFNTLYQHNKQVIITSDQPPKLLTGFEQRMISRFSMGLITDVQTPNLETRIAILQKKAQNDKLQVPYEVLEYIAELVYTNIRELEGTLIRVAAWSSVNNLPMDLESVKTILQDVISLEEDYMISPTEIVNATAEYFKVSIDDIYGSSRSQQIALARQIAMYLCRVHTNLSLPKIGQLFGNRDHTTVMYAHRKISGLMSERRSIYNNVTELTNRIKNQH